MITQIAFHAKIYLEIMSEKFKRAKIERRFAIFW